ncbi:mechanosensitive channel MscK [Conservatibacter flavescens]
MKTKKYIAYLLISIGLLLQSQFVLALPTEKELNAQLKAAQESSSESSETKVLVKDLEQNLSLLAEIEKQKIQNQQLETEIQNAPSELEASKKNLVAAKQKSAVKSVADLEKLSLNQLQVEQSAIIERLQQIQTALTKINAQVITQNAVPERAQSILTAGAQRTQEINSQLLGEINQPLRNKLETELVLIDLKNNYAQSLLYSNDILTQVYEAQREEQNWQQQQLQAESTNLQEAINAKYLQASQAQVEQVAKNQQETFTKDTSPIVLSELQINATLSKDLVAETTQMNILSQDNLRIKNMLDNLQQTQRNIDEQISALQGTLALSRIINKQKQALPQDEMVKGLAKRISDLRVKLFDLAEMRDKLTDSERYIQTLATENKLILDTQDKVELESIVAERLDIVSNLIRVLNNQLNASINIDLNQQQVIAISDDLHNKLQQQSFWVKSNAPIDVDWVKNFLPTATWQLKEINKLINFFNWKDHVLLVGSFILLLLILSAGIYSQKEKIKRRIKLIDGQINTLSADSQWHTPAGIFWTFILCLPSTMLFLVVLLLAVYIIFETPTPMLLWCCQMAGYWLFFAFMLAILRPNGLAFRHFALSQQSAEMFRQVLKRSIWLVILLLNTSVLTHLDSTGVTNDAIGEVVTVTALIISLFIVGPRFRHAISTYESNTHMKQTDSRRYLFVIARLVLILSPVMLISLIVVGYYYTALTLIKHLMASYFVLVTWILLREVVYRAFAVSARRLAYRRLQEKRAQTQIKAETEEGQGELASLEEDELEITQVRTQVLSMVDFVLWVGLGIMLFWVWADLITVANYLDGFTLWQQNVTTESGTVVESITLLNLLKAIVILVVTYAIVRNIAGILEVAIFSRFTLSQGTPYTITTLSSYFVIAIGAALAFSTLGVSWSKLQWLFAALSVGLGFGLQEIFANFVSGIIILFERPARIGDVITIGQYSGTVSRIRMRATTLVDFDGKEVIVPNKAFVTERLTNWALSNSVTRIVIKIGVAYGSDLELTRQLLLQAASESEKVLKEPAPKAYFLNFGDSTLDHEMRVYVGQIGDRTVTIDFLNRRINQLFNENNIDIAFNQLDVFIKNQTTGDEVKVVEKPLVLNN